MSNEFIWPIENYQQNINPLKQYVEQSAKFLSVQRGISLEDAEKAVRAIMRDRRFSNLEDPSVVYFERDDNWVRNLKTGTLSNYLRSTIEAQEVIVPTMTTYIPASVKKSLSSIFMERNAKRRGVLKHQAQVEELRGNEELAYLLNNQQDNAKRNNNSMSGIMAAIASIFENPTGHNTLTSITRSMSSVSNALNERMIAGNRHYMTEVTALNNMTAIVATMDDAAVQECIDLFQLHVPTPEEIGELVYKSASKYWRDIRHIDKVIDYARKMTGTQRAAVAYTQDLFHMRVMNDAFMRRLVDDLSITDKTLTFDTPEAYIKQSDPLVLNYAIQMNTSVYTGMDKDRSRWDPSIVLLTAQSCATVSRAVEKYKKLLNAFFVVRTVPCSTAYINHMSREAVVLSDTDSTMFAIDNWVVWYFGKLQFHDHSFAVSGSIMFLSTQLIAHALAILSANMNVAREKLSVLSMKPEFVFPVFAQTPVAKHYFCSSSVKEGGVFKSNKYEIKGVHLKNSASPEIIVKTAQNRMTSILEEIQAGKLLNLGDEIRRVADLERTIIASIEKGESTYLKRVYVKTPQSYTKGPTESPYRYHTLWNQVFGPSYSEVDAPPYAVLKFPLLTTTKTKMMTWLKEMKDRTLADRYVKYLQENGKSEIKTIYISQDFVQAYGIPKEIRDIINIRKVVLDLLVIDRMILETIGYRPKYDTLLSEIGY